MRPAAGVACRRPTVARVRRGTWPRAAPGTQAAAASPAGNQSARTGWPAPGTRTSRRRPGPGRSRRQGTPASRLRPARPGPRPRSAGQGRADQAAGDFAQQQPWTTPPRSLAIRHRRPRTAWMMPASGTPPKPRGHRTPTRAWTTPATRTSTTPKTPAWTMRTPAGTTRATRAGTMWPARACPGAMGSLGRRAPARIAAGTPVVAMWPAWTNSGASGVARPAMARTTRRRRPAARRGTRAGRRDRPGHARRHRSRRHAGRGRLARARAGQPGGADSVATTDASDPRKTSPSQVRDPGSVRDNGSVRDGGAARDTHPAGTPHAGTGERPRPGQRPRPGRPRTGRPGRVRHGTAARRGKPLPAGTPVLDQRGIPAGTCRGTSVRTRSGPGGRETADFLAAPPPSGSILTTAPRPETRTARPANVGTETIAAELAGWAAGELPGQASARLAAWAAIGGVPAPGYHRPTAPTRARLA